MQPCSPAPELPGEEWGEREGNRVEWGAKEESRKGERGTKTDRNRNRQGCRKGALAKVLLVLGRHEVH